MIKFLTQKSLRFSLLIVVGTILVFFYVLHRQLNLSTTSSPVNTNSSNQPSAQVAPADREYISNGYFYAKDLGIRFKISDELISQGLIASVTRGEFDGPVVSLHFTTKFLSDSTENCSLGEGGALGILARFEGQYQELPSAILVKQFQNFYITYNNGGYNCAFDSTASIQEKLNKAGEDFRAAIFQAEQI